MIKQSKIIALFDEYGTPSFKNNATSGHFMGVCALYQLSDEQQIFKALEKPMGLPNTHPLKNSKIGKSRAKEIAAEVSNNNFYITAIYIDLSNNQLKQTVNDYLNVSNFGRKIWRRVEGRKEAHLIHSQLLLHSIFQSFITYLDDNSEDNIQLSTFVDKFRYLKSDLDIILNYSSQNLNKHVKKFLDEKPIDVNIEPFVFLTRENILGIRKRIIDGLCSIISRSIFDVKSEKFDLQPKNLIEKGLGYRFKYEDLTNETIQFLNNSMYDDIQNTKIQDKPLIIL